MNLINEASSDAAEERDLENLLNQFDEARGSSALLQAFLQAALLLPDDKLSLMETKRFLLLNFTLIAFAAGRRKMLLDETILICSSN